MTIKLIDSTSCEYGVEHTSYSFDISGISRACLQELVRHKVASYTIKSSRYTLQELKDEESFIYHNKIPRLGTALKYIVLLDDRDIDYNNCVALEKLRLLLVNGVPNDKAKYCMPEAYKTSLVMTINARSLQNFLELRSSKHALWEIQLLAKAMYEAIPDEHKFLFDNIFKEEIK